MARVDAIYRRVEMSKESSGAKEQDDTVILGEFVLNPRNRTLTKSGRFIDLTQVEFQIMECFFSESRRSAGPDGYPEPCLGQARILERKKS